MPATANTNGSPCTAAVPLLIEGHGPAAVQPVTVGLPLPRGLLKQPAQAAVIEQGGRAVPCQTQALARWPDGSVRWLLVDAVLPSLPPGTRDWMLQPQPGSEAPPSSLHVEDAGEEIIVKTGKATFHLTRNSVLPLARVIAGGKDLLAAGSARAVLTDAQGNTAATVVERVEVEEKGPVRATLRLEGRIQGGAPGRFLARACFFMGTGLLRLRLTLHNPRRAQHPGGLWDLGDRGSIYFRELALELALAGCREVRFTTEPGRPPRTAAGPLEIYQDSSGGENWASRNHVNRHGQVPCRFRGYRARSGTEESRGDRALPVVTLAGENGTLTAAVPEFWQQFPKALEVRDGLLRIGLFPHQWNDLHELQGGEQKTHTVWLCFDPAGTESRALDWVHSPAMVRASPQWYAASGAVGHLPACEERVGLLDGYLRDVVDGETSLVAWREVIDEYGWRHFGEVYADHENGHYDGPNRPVVSHYNNQYDMVLGGLLQYWRTGDGRWREVFDPLARHVIDIDIYHTREDRSAYNGGLFWFTDHYKDAATCTHRTYSRANARPGDRSYGGGPSSSHNFATGLLYYYYQTGEPLARDAVLSLADWVVAMDDGRQNVLGLIDDGPTGLASGTAQPDYHGPGRGPGLSIQALVDGWLVSGRRAYLDKAEELIRRCVHPADDVAARDLLNVELRWSYTVFFAALARYLDLKAEAGESDLPYAYAQASLLHYARWMLENERPYFDHPEQLEYPTEAWAGQEFRKANVLRLAAAHAEEPLRGQLLRRGAELADRAWHDLMGFETRFTARAIALVMTEGARDLFFRTQAAPLAPRPAANLDFGSPENFVPQKQRALARLRTLRGLAQTCLRLARPSTWRRLLDGKASGQPTLTRSVSEDTSLPR
jgi:hypothetical protein